MKKKVQMLIRTGRRYNSSFFRVYLKPSDSYKTGFIANRKTGRASVRTRIKRLIREFWKRNFVAGDFLFVLKPGIEKTDNEILVRALENTAEKIKCRNS